MTSVAQGSASLVVSGYVRDTIVFFEEVQVGVRVEVDEQGVQVSGECQKD